MNRGELSKYAKMRDDDATLSGKKTQRKICLTI